MPLEEWVSGSAGALEGLGRTRVDNPSCHCTESLDHRVPIHWISLLPVAKRPTSVHYHASSARTPFAKSIMEGSPNESGYVCARAVFLPLPPTRKYSTLDRLVIVLHDPRV